MSILDQEPKTHENHCYHVYRKPILMVVPDGHVVEKCCWCPSMRTIHADHVAWRRDGH